MVVRNVKRLVNDRRGRDDGSIVLPNLDMLCAHSFEITGIVMQMLMLQVKVW